VLRETEVKAKIFPANIVPPPSVAEEPTWKKTLQAWAPLVRTTWAAAPVMNVVPIWKTKTLEEFPPPSRVRMPLSVAVVSK